ncbi:Transcriptional factor IIA alpha/beta subunit [Mycena chlorophos]|uniref:Transcriptional factor IIA alpha/beta subunit n=1 Tax=Mycena chlorophos TaxID=658473 RepID=A0A8H6TJ00_MYCCL|nr:Transcriptional factor IIA alpha/beta subunit [Mycena chlorophos]
MSNKLVAGVYRDVINEVIAALEPEFEEYGVQPHVLTELKTKWEAKMTASRVADFNGVFTPNAPQVPSLPVPHYPTYVPPNAAQQAAVARVQAQPIKPEALDHRFAAAAYQLPPLPGPTLPAHLAFPSAVPQQQAALQQQQRRPTQQRTVQGQQQMVYRINQVDGPADDDDDDEDDYDEEVPIAPPRPAHPSISVPVPSAASANSSQSRDEVDPEAITSDLDDSDTENEDENEDPNSQIVSDVVFCTYDKVARVKNKWKCVLKDGMIHTGGKDFLFQKCTGEFEW